MGTDVGTGVGLYVYTWVCACERTCARCLCRRHCEALSVVCLILSLRDASLCLH